MPLLCETVAAAGEGLLHSPPPPIEARYLLVLPCPTDLLAQAASRCRVHHSRFVGNGRYCCSLFSGDSMSSGEIELGYGQTYAAYRRRNGCPSKAGSLATHHGNIVGGHADKVFLSDS